MAAISRADLTESVIENGRICSHHFASGKPADLFDELNPDWLPTENLGHSKVNRKRVVMGEERYQRKKARVDAVHSQMLELSNSTSADANSDHKEGSSSNSRDEQHMGQQIDNQTESELCTSEVQTTLTSHQITLTQQELNSAYEKIRLLEAQIAKIEPFTEATLQNDKCVQFYTGLPKFKLLKTIFDFVSPEKPSSTSAHTLAPFQEFIAVLIKLRLNPPLQDLAY